MFTDKRLLEACKNAKVEYFDDDSRYIFFSDSHRGDNGLSDEFSKNQNIFLYALDYYFYNGYTYVEAGDGDELLEYSKFRHIRVAHSDTFLTLKKFFDDERFTMLYGNHNIFLRNEDYVKKNLYHFLDEYNEEECELFKGIVPYEALILKNKNTGQEILTVHGHQGDFMNDQFWFGTMIMLRYFWRFLRVVGFQNPASPAKNLNKRHKIEKAYNKWIGKHKMMLICGHTHRPKFPRNGEMPYFNTGCCIHSRGITGLEIVEGRIMLVEWGVRADREGVLKISRKVIRGPEPIEKYR